MKIVETKIESLLVIEPWVLDDNHGLSLEGWNPSVFAELDLDFEQDNDSRLTHCVVRSLNYQYPNPRGKLMRVTSGRAWDVAIVLRAGLQACGHWAGFELSAGNKRMFCHPFGFAHGFLGLEEGADFLCKCNASPPQLMNSPCSGAIPKSISNGLCRI